MSAFVSTISPRRAPPRIATGMSVSQAEAGEAAFGALAGITQHVAADHVIYAEGDAATAFYKVARGVVRACKFLSDGRRQIDAFYNEGDVFGLEVGGLHRMQAEAVSDCTLVAYRWRGLDFVGTEQPALARHFLTYAMQRLESAQDHSLLLGRRSAAQKLAVFLLDQADRSPDSKTIELAMTRQDIGDYLGLTIETVSRTVSQFERDALISLPASRRVILCRRDVLQDLCD